MSCNAAQNTTAPVCATGGKPSTRLPPGGLVEQARVQFISLSMIYEFYLGHSLLEREGVRSTLLQVIQVTKSGEIIKKCKFLKIIKHHPRLSKITPNAS